MIAIPFMVKDNSWKKRIDKSLTDYNEDIILWIKR